MSALKNLIGQKFGRLTVIERAENDKFGRAQWLCKCDCGNTCVVLGKSLRRGLTQSCGCIHSEMVASRNKENATHGMRGSKFYKKWTSLKSRCFNPNATGYERYGGRGITMYEPWINDFAAFLTYISQLEHFGEKGFTLDRIENNGNYEPGNLRYADAKTQARNRRNNIIVEYNGEQICLAEAAEKSGIPYKILLSRYHRGETGARLFRPIGSK